jgi:hypothetical protein
LHSSSVLGVKIETLEPKYLKNLGAKRVKITYGPYLAPGSDDPETHGMKNFADMNIAMPCRECLITGFVPDLVFEDGKTANVNNGMWLHHTGLMNLNRSDAACEEWPERMNVNGNERSPFDMTVAGYVCSILYGIGTSDPDSNLYSTRTRKAGYYIREGDQIFLTTEVMNLSQLPRPVYLAMEWEFVEGTPEGFDVVMPVWLDVKGNCLNETTGVVPKTPIFNVTMTSGWSPKFTGDLLFMVSHIHDGNIKQEVYLDGKMVCQSVPRYGEKAEFVTHVGEFGHEKETKVPDHEHEHEHEQKEEPGSKHDHGSDEHILHVSSINQCDNIGKVNPNSKLTISTFYDMSKHTAMKDHDGGLEPIMGIQFLHVALPRDVGLKYIKEMKAGDAQKFRDQVQSNNKKNHPAVF